MAEIMKQAVILAAGEGQRLRPFTVNRPKAMLSLAGRPLLDHVVAALVAGGIRDIVIVVGYRKEPILDYLGSGERYGAHITYITQEKQLGTAQALKLVEAAVGDDFLVLPGDNLIESGTLSDISAAAAPTVLAKRVAELLASGKVIGWLQGRMEFGPRALGNRSILANPKPKWMKDRVNEIKKEIERLRKE